MDAETGVGSEGRRATAGDYRRRTVHTHVARRERGIAGGEGASGRTAHPTKKPTQQATMILMLHSYCLNPRMLCACVCVTLCVYLLGRGPQSRASVFFSLYTLLR